MQREQQQQMSPGQQAMVRPPAPGVVAQQQGVQPGLPGLPGLPGT